MGPVVTQGLGEDRRWLPWGISSGRGGGAVLLGRAVVLGIRRYDSCDFESKVKVKNSHRLSV